MEDESIAPYVMAPMKWLCHRSPFLRLRRLVGEWPLEGMAASVDLFFSRIRFINPQTVTICKGEEKHVIPLDHAPHESKNAMYYVHDFLLKLLCHIKNTFFAKLLISLAGHKVSYKYKMLSTRAFYN